jgi:DNA-binding transcriptional regulator YiaG
MKPLNKETIDQAVHRLREKLSFENVRKIRKFEKLTKDKHAQMLNFIETMVFLLLDSYIRNNKRDL